MSDTTKPRSAKPSIKASLVGAFVLWTIIGALDAFLVLPTARQLIFSKSARPVEAVILEPAQFVGDTPRYTYQIDGTQYTSTRGTYSIVDREDQNYTGLGKSATVTAYISPTNPRQSTLTLNTSDLSVFLFLFFTPFHGAGVLYALSILSKLGVAQFKPMAGGARVRTLGTTTRVGLSLRSPFTSFIAGATVASFVAVFVLAFASNFSPPHETTWRAFTIIFWVGAAWALIGPLLARRRQNDLVIDRRASTVLLPRLVRARKTPIALPIADLVGVGTATFDSGIKSDGNSNHTAVHTPTLIDIHGESHRLVRWPDHRRADLLAKWLAESLRLPALEWRDERHAAQDNQEAGLPSIATGNTTPADPSLWIPHEDHRPSHEQWLKRHATTLAPSKKPSGEAAAILFLGLFGVVWIGFTAVFLTILLKGMVAQTIATGHPTTTGEILTSSVTTQSTSDGKSYDHTISYRYTVDGNEYIGDQIRHGFSMSSKAAAKQTLDRYPKGASVAVAYNPANPHDAILEPGIGGRDLMFITFMLPFTAIAIGIAMGFLGFVKRRRQGPASWGAKITQEPSGIMTLRIGMGPRTAGIAVALVVIGLAGFVSIFALALIPGAADTLWPPLAVLTAIFTAAAILGMRTRTSAARGDADLTIDPERETALLPAIDDHPRREISMRAITDLIIATKDERDSDGDKRTKYSPSVVFLTSTGESLRSPITELSNEREAIELTKWCALHMLPGQPS